MSSVRNMRSIQEEHHNCENRPLEEVRNVQGDIQSHWQILYHPCEGLESKTNIQNEVNYCVEQAIGEFIKT